MSEWRSTLLRMVERHCPKVVQYYEEGRESDLSITERGSAAHALLQAASEQADKLGRALTDAEREELASQVAARLIAGGRTFEGEPEPPLSVAPTWEGMQLGLDWLKEYGEQSGQYELALAVDRDGRPCEYGKDAHYRGILDFTALQVYMQAVRKIRDTKTYWSAGAAELAGVQIRGQAVLAHAHGLCVTDEGEPVDELVIEIGNMRTKSIYSETLYMRHPSAAETLKQWRLRIWRMIEQLEMVRRPNGEMPASPGPCCSGCPYLGTCEDARRYYDGEGVPGTAEERAVALAVTEARREQLIKICKADTDGAPVKMGKMALGTWPVENSTAIEFVGSQLAAEWEQEGGDVAGLLSALGVTSGNIKSVARVLHPGDTAAQEQWAEKYLTTKPGKKFGWREAE